MNPYSFTLLFFSFSGILVGVMVYLRRADSVGKYFFIFSLLSSFWAASIAINFDNGIGYENGLFWSRIGNVIAVFIPVAFFGFAASFSGKNNFVKRIIFPGWGCAIGISLFGFSRWFIPSVRPAVGFAYYASNPGPVFHLYTVFFSVLVILSLFLLCRAFLQANGERRAQAAGVLAASVTGFAGGSLSFLPIYGVMLPQYNLFLLPFYPFIWTYFILRKDLFNDVDAAYAAHKDKLAAIGTIAASVNHEIKNPLFVIRGLADSYVENRRSALFRSSEDTALQAEAAMQKTSAQVCRALEIMKNFSGFAKQSLAENPEVKPVMIQDAISRILPLVSYELQLDAVSIAVNLPDALPAVKADERYLEQIVFNLIVNSCQAMRNTGGEIVISAKESDGRVVLEIRDNGPGIPKEQQKQIFEPFYTTKDEGTGLGLYITKQLVERIGGKIALYSETGHGTRFALGLVKT